MYEQSRTHTSPYHTQQINSHKTQCKHQSYTLRTPAVYADLSYPHIHSQPQINKKHTQKQRIPNHKTIKNIHGRDKSAPTPNGMDTNHSWNVCNAHIYKKMWQRLTLPPH